MEVTLMAALIFEKGANIYTVAKKLTTISASGDADIRISGDKETLCYIEKKDDGFSIETIRGRGIAVNGRTVRRRKLAFGDVLDTGNDRAVFLDIDLQQPASLEKKEPIDYRALIESSGFKQAARAILDMLIAETYADKGMVLLLEDGEPSLLVGAEKDGMELLTGFSETIIRTVLLEKKPLLSNNVLSDERFSPSKSVVALKIMATLVLPIVREEMLYGLVYLWNSSTVHPFSGTVLPTAGFYAWILSVLLENERLKHGINTTIKRYTTDRRMEIWQGLASASPAMTVVFGQCSKLAQTDTNIVICGEKGTGKKSLAKAMHNLSGKERSLHLLRIKEKNPEVLADEFAMLQNGGIGEGTEKGTGTVIADGPDFLPEDLYPAFTALIDAMPGVRWIFLMEKDPDAKDQMFDDRLRTRLGEIIIRVPALKDRGRDAGLLASRFLDEFCTMYKKDIRGFTEKAERALESRTWEGNVAELMDVVKKAVIESETDTIDADALGIEPPGAELTPLGQAKEEFMKRYIRMALEAAKGDKIGAAKMLGVSQRTIYKYLEENK